MREPPDLAGAAIASALGAGFGIRRPTLTFLPIGNDAASWAYRVGTDGGGTYFLKVRAGTAAIPGAAVPSHLQRQGVPNILAPLPTGDGAPYITVDRFALMLYPMLEAGTGAEAGMSPDRWRKLGATLRQVHTTPPAPELTRMVGREAFRPTRGELIAELDRQLTAGPDDPVAAELAAFWLPRRDVIHALAERAGELGRQLAGERPAPVLCHADLHTWNVLVAGDQLWIVDWDEATLAPRERDLMFVIGGISRQLVRPSDTEHFLQGYGETTVDARLLAYYRTAWAVQDLAAYGEQILLAPTAGHQSRRAALDGLIDLFEPGGIVEIATAPDATGPALR